jgi:hypothetical protein
MGTAILILLGLGAFVFGSKTAPPSSDVPVPTPDPKPLELGKRVGLFSSSDVWKVAITRVSATQFGWYAYDPAGVAVGSGSEGDDDRALRTAWEFLVSKMAADATVRFTILNPISGLERGSGEVALVEAGWVWAASTKAPALATTGTATDSRGDAMTAMLDWLEKSLIMGGKDGIGATSAGNTVGVDQLVPKYTGNGIAIDASCKLIAVTDFPAFVAYAKPIIREAFDGASPPTADTLGRITLGRAAGLDGCPRPLTKVNGQNWAQIRNVVRDVSSAVTRADWLSVADPTVVLAHMLVGTDPEYDGVAERYKGRAYVIRPSGGQFEILIFGKARTLDEDGVKMFGPSLNGARVLAKQAIDGMPPV